MKPEKVGSVYMKIALLSFLIIPFVQSTESFIPLQVTIPLTDLKKAAIAHQLTPQIVFGWKKWKQVPVEVKQTLCMQQITDYIKQANPSFIADPNKEKTTQQIVTEIVHQVTKVDLSNIIHQHNQQQLKRVLGYTYYMKELIHTLPPEIMILIKEKVELPFFLKHYIRCLPRSFSFDHPYSIKLYNNYIIATDINTPKSLYGGTLQLLFTKKTWQQEIRHSLQLMSIDIHHDNTYLQHDDQGVNFLTILNTNKLLELTKSEKFNGSNIQVDFLTSLCTHNHYLAGLTKDNEIWVYNKETGSRVLYFESIVIKHLAAFDNSFVAADADNKIYIFKECFLKRKLVTQSDQPLIDMITSYKQLVTAYNEPTPTLTIWSPFTKLTQTITPIKKLSFSLPITNLKNIIFDKDNQVIQVSSSRVCNFINLKESQIDLRGIYSYDQEIINEISNYGITWINKENRIKIVSFPIPLLEAWKQITFAQLSLIYLHKDLEQLYQAQFNW